MKYKFYLRTALFTAFFFVNLSGCISDNSSPEGGNPVAGTAVEFPTTISKTRAFDDKWEWGDEIGVYMIPASSTARHNWSGIELYAANKRYIHDMDEGDEPDDEVVFSGFDDANTIMWPGDKRTFDVVAYYPWTSSVTGNFLYSVDLSDQTSQKEIDLMWSNNVRGQSSGAPALGFVHKLAKLVFNVTDSTGASLDEMTSTFDGLPTTASFDLSAGEIVEGTESGFEPFEGNLHSTSDDNGNDEVAESAIVEAIVLPGSHSGSYTVTFTLKDNEQAEFTVASPDYVAGNRYVYNISLTPPVQEGASFGADGGLEQIAPWDDGEGDEGTYPGEIPKTNDPGTGGELSDMWRTDQGVQFASPVTVAGGVWAAGSYKITGDMTITKPDCEGIASVMVILTSSGTQTTIGSVTVGDHALAIDHDSSSATPPVESYTLPVTSTETNFVFKTTDGKPHSGDVTIQIAIGGGSANVYGFGTNTDIAEKNR